MGKFYDISNLKKVDAQYKILLGERANGKSYQVKLTCLEEAFKSKKKFVYLRRWKEDIKTAAVEAYFSDMDFLKITDGEFSGIEAWRNEIYFFRYDDMGRKIKSEAIGRYCALNDAERYKSWAFENFDNMIFEEFITDQSYIAEEPRKLQQFVSTVARHRAITVYMIGNTLNRICPYFAEWCLEGVLKQKQGTIEVYHFHVEDAIINIAVEYCKNADFKNKMFFGQSAKQIVSGEWDTTDSPRLPKKYKDYEKVYEILLKFQSFRFAMELLVEPENGGRLVYIYPCTNPNREFYRIITDQFSDQPNITNRLILKKRPEAIMYDLLNLDKICFSDNLTAADFRHILDFMAL